MSNSCDRQRNLCGAEPAGVLEDPDGGMVVFIEILAGPLLGVGPGTEPSLLCHVIDQCKADRILHPWPAVEKQFVEPLRVRVSGSIIPEGRNSALAVDDVVLCPG